MEDQESRENSCGWPVDSWHYGRGGALAEIYTSSLIIGEGPEDQRLANVPLFKKVCKEKTVNYRPVSLASMVF